jgi:energy-coupling factor transport system permease protein
VLSDSLPLFSYEGGASPAAQLDARIKILASLVGVAGILLAHHVVQFFILGALVLASQLAARLPIRLLWRSLQPILAFMLIGGMITALATSGSGWTVGFVHISAIGLALAIRLSVQLVLLLTTTTILTYTTSPFALASAMRRLLGFLQRVHVPIDDVITMLTIAITFMPIMSREIDRYLTARAARGVNVRHLGLWAMLGELIVPTIESSLRRGEELTMALESRVYGYRRRTRRAESRLDRTSLAVLLTICTVVGLTLALM